jgi:hypothetical protein
MQAPRRFVQNASVLVAGLALVALGMALAPNGARAQVGPGPGGGTGTTQNPVLRQPMPAFATSDSNEQMIAVTGIDLTGSSVLYLIDTQNRQLAVYQANGGSESTQGLKLIGARRIDLDLKLYGFNDKSEYSFEELEKRFAEREGATVPPKK